MTDTLPSITKISTKDLKIKLKEEFNRVIKDKEKMKEIGSFIPSDKAISRLQKLDSNLSNKNYVLLEGPTGSCKTKTVQIYCKLKGLELIQFNMSEETNEEDLKGRILSDETSFSGLKFIRGHFSEAFINGKILLLDEINLANQTVLNFIANALDSKMLMIEQDENENGGHIFHMHENFRLIATQNPNDNSFLCKREELPEKLLQQFNIIYFPSLEKEEINFISKEIAKKNGYNNEEIINGITDLHYEWVNSENSKDSPQCFTIRDINSVIQSITKNKDYPFDALMCFYGMRYQLEKRNIFQNLIQKNNKIPKEQKVYEFSESKYKNCYPSQSFQQVDKYAEIAISNKRHILFTGKEGVGITSIAKWIARRHSKNPEKDFTFVFTEETTIGDLIGRFIPTSEKGEKNIIEWKDGPLTEAINNGYSGIFLNIESTDPKILERINCLLDQKDTENDNIFKIPENPNRGNIQINSNFHFYCTCSLEKMDSLSDAFLNRLTVIVIDDQLNGLNKDNYTKLITSIMLQENLKNELNKELINSLVEMQIKSNLSMSELARLTKSCLYLSEEFPEIDPERNLNYIKNLLENNKDICIPLEIISRFDAQIIQYNRPKNAQEEEINLGNIQEEKFYFNSIKIRDLMCNIYTCMICNINICLIGKTGIGKTHFARTFSQIFGQKKEINHILFSFNSESTMENLYGTFAFENGRTMIVEGPLYKAIKEGLIFIADEFNLAEESIIQSFMNVLKVTTQSLKILIPGINITIPYNKNCFIIICQNDSNTKGRRSLPNSIKKKIKIFEYPEPDFQDINFFTLNIIMNELNKNELKENSNLATKLSKIYISLNKKEIPDIESWSMRDIRKILRRIDKQKNSPNEYKNIKDIHQILIYIFSGVPKNKVDSVFEEILPLFKEPFFLKDKDIEDLRLMINSKAKIEVIDEYKYLMKGNCGKRIFDNIEKVNENLSSFLDSLFYANFVDIREPILIYGPSGYKTELAKAISFDSQIIHLYPETSLSQLLGSTHIRDNNSAKKYYLKEILSICKKKSCYREMEIYLEKYIKDQSNKPQNKSLTERSSIKNIKSEIENIIQNSDNNKGKIKDILERLKENILSFNKTNEEDNIFGNFTSYFQAGILIQNIFTQKYIILKGVDNLSPNVLERFNDLLNYSPKIILNEDLYNTFTGEDKEISNFSDNFRIIGISSIENINNFSEASKSRFTLISTSKYSPDEKIWLINYKLTKCKCLTKFIEFLTKFDKKYEDEISFKIIIKITTIFQKFKTLENDTNQERYMILAIYYSLLPFLQKEEVEYLIELLEKIFISQNVYFIKDNNNKFLKFQFQELENDIEQNNPFKQTANEIISYSTGLSIRINNEENKEDENDNFDEIQFHKSFNNLLDIIHLSLFIHIPLIIEGETGNGKKTAIYYIAKLLKYHILNIQITESTTIEELFCKEVINPDSDKLFFLEKTELYNAIIKSNYNFDEPNEKEINENNTIIFLENIEQASPSILEALIPLFDESLPTFLLPFGLEGNKKIYNLIVTYDPTKFKTSFQNFFPIQILNNSIIFKLQNPGELEYSNILKAMTNFQESYNDENYEKISNNFFISKNYAIDIQGDELFTINDLKKYELFRNQSTNLDNNDDLISRMIFPTRYSSKKQKDDLENKLGFKKENINLEIDFEPENDDFSSFSIFQKSGLNNNCRPTFEYSSPIDIDEKQKLEESFYELTDYQKKAMLFLLFGVNTKMTCIIQGPSCSGKTHLIKEFSKLCHKELEIFDLSNESNISLLTGQLTTSSKISEENIKELQQLINQGINKSTEFKKILKDNLFDINTPEKWTPKQFDNIIKELKNLQERECNPDKIINSIIENMKKERSFSNYLKNKDSLFIQAMTQGKWILLNGIEFAQPELSQKLISLCNNENPYLNLFEKGKDYQYSKNNDNEKLLISDDFRLFITYNPFSVETNKRLSSGFLNKCLVFSLFPIEDNITNVSHILSKAFNKNKKLGQQHKQLAAKLSSIHFKCKELSNNNNVKMIGKISFCGRTLLSVINYINNSSLDIKNAIINALNDCYCNSFLKKKEVKNEILKIYCDKPNDELLNYLNKEEKAFDKKYPQLFEKFSIIINEKDNKDYIIDFFNLCCKIEFIDINELNRKIKNTILTRKIKHSLLFMILNIISNIFCFFIRNKYNKILVGKKIEDNDLEENVLLIIHNKMLTVRKMLEENYIKISNINFEFKDYKNDGNLLYDAIIENNSIEDLIIFGFRFPESENKDKYKCLLQDLPIYKKNLFKIAFVISKGIIKEEDIITIINNLKNILNNKLFFYITNNENMSEDNIKNIIKTIKNKEDLSNLSEEIEEFKNLVLSNIIDIDHYKQEKNELIKIIDNWKKNCDDLNDKVQISLGNHINRLNIEEEIKKYKDILNNKKTEISKEEKKCYNNYIETLIHLLKNNNTVNSQDFEVIKDNFSHFQSLLTKRINKENKEDDFPFFFDIDFIEKKEPSSNLKMIEQLINYTIVKNNLVKIIENQDKIKHLMEIYLIINDEEELLKNIIDDFFYFILKSNDNNSIKKEVIKFESKYKAFLLNKIDLSYIDENEIIKSLNDLTNRNTINQNDLNWVSKIYSLKYGPYFEIIIPKFNPKDILNLFALSYDSKEGTLGFFSSTIGIINIKNYINTINEAKDQDISYSDCLNILINNYLKICEPNYKSETLNDAWNLEKIEDIIKNNSRLSKPTQIYLTKIKDLFKAIKNIDNAIKINSKLIYDDLFFINDKNWYKNNNEISLKYPSMCFYLIRNPKCEESFIHYYSCFKPKDDKIPLYFIFLRLKSHKGIIKCDDYKEDNNPISKSIKQKLNTNINNYLNNNFPKDINWIGLFTIDFFKKDIKPIMKEIRFFLYNYVNFHEQKEDKVILNILENKIIDFIFNKTVEGKIEEYFNMNLFLNKKFIEDNNQLIYFINPCKSINEENNEKKKGFEKELIEGAKKCYKQISPFSIKMNDEFYESFISKIKTAMEKKRTNLREINRVKQNEMKQSEVKAFRENTNGYINNYKRINTTKDRFNSIIKYLSDYTNQLKKYSIFNYERKIEIGTITFLNFTNSSFINKDLEIKIEKNGKSIKFHQKDLYNNNMIFYDLNNYGNHPDIFINSELIKDIEYSKTSFYEISDEKKSKIENQLISDKDIPIKEPQLIFIKNNGEIYTFSDINIEKNPKLQSISYLFKQFLQFCHNFDTSLNEREKLLNLKEDISKLLYLFKSTFDYKKAQFDNEEVEINDINDINIFISQFQDFKANIIFLLNQFKEYIESYKNKEFTYHCPNKLSEFVLPNIHDINILQKELIFDLDNHNVDYFVSISRERKINFHSGKFSKIIGPIIPEFYKNQKYVFQIFSFVDKNINLSIQFNKNQDFKFHDCFSVSSFIQSLKPIQIFFRVPEIKVDKPTQTKIVFDLIINLEGDYENICKIECEFYIQFLPLNIYISSSKGLLILEQEQEQVKLNIGSFLEWEEFDIKFEIPSFENYEIFNSAYYMLSLKDNTAKRPTLSFNKEKKNLNIVINDYEHNKDHLHFLIIISIIDDIKINIEINAIIYKREFILTFINLLDDYEDEYLYNYIIFNKKGISPSLNINLLDDKEIKIKVNKKSNTNIQEKETQFRTKQGYLEIKLPEMNKLKNNRDFLYISLKIYHYIFNGKFNKIQLDFLNNTSLKEKQKKLEDLKKYILKKRKEKEIQYKNKNAHKVLFYSNFKEKQFRKVEKNKIIKDYDISNFIQIENINQINSVNINPENYKNPDLSKINTLNDYLNFYIKLADLSQSLPYLVKIDNYPKDDINNLFCFLFAFYKESKKHNYCIISQEMYHFVKTFENSCNIMKKSGIQFYEEGINIPQNESLYKIKYIPTKEPKPNELKLRDKTKWNDEDEEYIKYSDIIKDNNNKEERETKKKQIKGDL